MNREKLISLYQKSGKHSQYQELPNAIREVLPADTLQVNSRFEKERLDFICERINIEDKTVMDIGGNTGYFSFELLDEGAEEVTYIEGNADHARFVEEAADMLGKNIKVINEYLEFNGALSLPNVDITLLLNVVHHLGDDFGNAEVSLKKSKKEMARCLNYFYDKTEQLVFQMGYCWKGDTSKLLFDNGTKREMIDFVEQAIGDYWDIISVGIPEIINGETVYRPPTEHNLKRKNEMGEFLNRPIFILRSK